MAEIVSMLGRRVPSTPIQFTAEEEALVAKFLEHDDVEFIAHIMTNMARVYHSRMGKPQYYKQNLFNLRIIQAISTKFFEERVG